LRALAVRTPAAQICGTVTNTKRRVERAPTASSDPVKAWAKVGTITRGSKNANPIEKATKSTRSSSRLRRSQGWDSAMGSCAPHRWGEYTCEVAALNDRR